MTDPIIEPTPISKMEQLTVPPSGTSLVPAIVWNPDKLGPNVGGWESKAVPVSALAGALVNKLISRHGAPTSLIGSDGDVYIDLDTFEFYNPKAGGVWPTPPTPMLASVQLAALNQAAYASAAESAAKRARAAADSALSKIAPFIFQAASEARRAKANATAVVQAAVSGAISTVASFSSSAARSARRSSSEADRAVTSQMMAITLPFAVARQVRSRTANDVATVISSQLLAIQGYMSRAYKAALSARAAADQVAPRALQLLAAAQQILRRAKADAAYAGTAAVTGVMPVLFSLEQSCRRNAWLTKSAVDTQLAQVMVRAHALGATVKRDTNQAKQAAAMTLPLVMEAAAFAAAAARAQRVAKAYSLSVADDQIALKSKLFG